MVSGDYGKENGNYCSGLRVSSLKGLRGAFEGCKGV